MRTAIITTGGLLGVMALVVYLIRPEHHVVEDAGWSRDTQTDRSAIASEDTADDLMRIAA